MDQLVLIMIGIVLVTFCFFITVLLIAGTFMCLREMWLEIACKTSREKTR